MKKFLVTAFLLALTSSIKAQTCFSLTYSQTVGNTPYGICNADFDADGNTDIVFADGANALRMYRGNGDGTFTNWVGIPVGGTPEGVIAADLNNDGRPDLACANFNSNNISVVLNTGSGFAASLNIPTATNSKDLTAADFDGDGDLDLAVANAGANSVSILLGNGSGAFSLWTNLFTASTPFGVCSADFNADGNKDVVTANNGGSNMSIMLGNGDGTFQSQSTFGSITTPYSALATDLDQDGKMDVIATSNNNNVTFFMGNGDGTFSINTHPLPPSSSGARSACVNDFNGDGIKDVACANFASNSVCVMFGPGYGGQNFPVSGANGVRWITTGDFNADGKPEFAETANTNGMISAFLNNNPFLSVSSNTITCSGTSVVLTASGANTYTWSSNASSVTTATASVSPTSNTTYTVLANTTGCAYTPQAVVTVSVNPVPFGLTIFYNGPTTICQGDSTTMQAVPDAGTTNVWMPGNLTTTFVTVTPTVTTNYTVTSTYTATGCSYSSNFPTINVKTSPTLSVSATATAVCSGTPVTLTASGANTYTWTGGVSNGVAFSPTTTATYSVVGTATNSCTGKATQSITVYQLPTVVANASPSGPVCAGTPLTLTGSGTATTYTWSGGVSNGVVFPASFQSYTVTGVDGNNCVNTATISVNAPLNPAPTICMLTADSLALNNIIYWENSLYTTADSFIIYRYDAFSSNYLVIGTVSKDSSRFSDTQRNIGGPNGGDPQYGSWQYKLAVKDTCGNVSAKSPYHQSVFVQDQHNNNFNWNAYTIEAGQSNPVTGYSFLRDDNNTGAWHVLINTAGLSATDPNYLSFPNGNWRVDALGFNCSANLRTINGVQTTIIKSKSNISNNRTTGLKGDLRKLVSLYPNPSNGNTTLSLSQYVSGNVSLTIYSALGQEVHSRLLVNPSGEIPLDLKSYENGIYFIKIVTSGQAVTIPFTKYQE